MKCRLDGKASPMIEPRAGNERAIHIAVVIAELNKGGRAGGDGSSPSVQDAKILTSFTSFLSPEYKGHKSAPHTGFSIAVTWQNQMTTTAGKKKRVDSTTGGRLFKVTKAPW